MSYAPDLSTLGQRVAKLAAELQKYRNEDAQDTDRENAYEEALGDALDEIRLGLVPSARWWQGIIMSPADSAAIQIAFRSKLFEYIPLNTPIEIHELATLVKIPKDHLGRVLRLLVLNRVVAELEPGRFSHTPLSLAASTSETSKGAGFLFSIFSSAGSNLFEAITSGKEGHTAWEEAFGAPVYGFFESNPTEREQFGAALAALAAPDMDDLAEMFPWESLTKLVDVGGGAGHVAVTLARKHKELRVVNQDLPGVIEDCKEVVVKMSLEDPERKVYSRIDFQAHDFYAPQPESNADAYLLRQCLHNNSDADCVRILKALVPGLWQAHARLLINETVLEDQPTGSIQKAKRLRQKDIMAMTIGAKERTRNEFQSLLQAADARYEIEHVYHGRGDLALLSCKLINCAP